MQTPELYASGLEQPFDNKQARRSKRSRFLDQVVDPMDSAAAMDAACALSTASAAATNL